MFESNEYSDDELAFESEYGDGQDGIHDMVFDFGRATENFTRKFNAHNVDDPIEGSSNASGEINETINDPNREAIKFYRLLQEVEQNLYPGCEDFSKLSFIVQILNFKYLYSVSAKAIDALLKILVKAFPKDNINARFDLECMGIRPELYATSVGDGRPQLGSTHIERSLVNLDVIIGAEDEGDESDHDEFTYINNEDDELESISDVDAYNDDDDD
ncbi:hypothetical protein V6N13_121522 [Hibiscus sabdariffa]|uniref:Uncharacterized protein n=1 Tax=Hibiscus sabdariffa TaxID=183260 RepID=A0ABR2PDF0_9ROSI